MSGNTEIRRLTKEAQRRREQTQFLGKRVQRLKQDDKKQPPPPSESPDQSPKQT